MNRPSQWLLYHLVLLSAGIIHLASFYFITRLFNGHLITHVELTVTDASQTTHDDFGPDEDDASQTPQDDSRAVEEVDFEHVGDHFTPGCIILTELHGRQVAARFDSATYLGEGRSKSYWIRCSYMDWDGTRVVPVEKLASIPYYPGTKTIDKLECCPLAFHPDSAAIEQQLRERGRRWEALRSHDRWHQAYRGDARYSEDNTPPTGEHIARGRIMLDVALWKVGSPKDAVWHEYKSAPTPLCDDCVILTSPIVRGFSLDKMRWMHFFVDHVKEIRFDDRATKLLVLEEEKKKLIMTLAKRQVNYPKYCHVSYGRGAVMLLSGGPGTGKTLTAQVVAEKLRAPLFKMNAGDLGSSPDAVEKRLYHYMGLVSRWRAILVLKDCDVFLAKRTKHDLVRNHMVSIFLRMLEYNEGIVILTTNCITDIDPAFRDRIPLVEYPNLGVAARRFVWDTFLARVGGSVGAKGLNVLSKIDLNGRQIDNMVRMADLMAEQAGRYITFEDVLRVLKMRGYPISKAYTISELVRLQDLI
ncbi:ATPase, AAA-type, core [Cordyceps militaris CM01]|uniref:ATPase, AAA-type, core n=1 Tax=Cordyceps militaris (strain CM01) TaxID=983644 RepID=G3JPE1_CORMM|nr:ATPase, AAA-type, core [Cordyceps militaris CM01]EGX89751.1 ATPase, AAA-type, core [Cordyceps militaris CM01]